MLALAKYRLVGLRPLVGHANLGGQQDYRSLVTSATHSWGFKDLRLSGHLKLLDPYDAPSGQSSESAPRNAGRVKMHFAELGSGSEPLGKRRHR